MIAFLLRRAGAALLTIWIALSVAFLILRLIPGDALTAQLALSGATEAQIVERLALVGLDQSLAGQYLNLIGALLRGDLGYSLISGRPVATIIGEQIGATASLAAGGLIVGVGIGLSLGGLATLARLQVVRLLARLIVALLLASPVYWTGTLAIFFLSVQLRLLPSAGSGDDLRFLLLPWLVLGLSIAGGLARLTAASLNDALEMGHIKTAYAKGLRRGRIRRAHLLRVSLGPIIAFVALQTGFLMGGAVVTEMIFVRRGLGQVLLTAVNERDYPVVQGIVMLSALAYSLAGLAADMIGALIDPRRRAA